MIVRWDSPARLLRESRGDDAQSDAERNPLACLSAEEHRRLASVTHERTRDQMAAARVLLRQTLAERYDGTAPQTWVVERDAEGAPWVHHSGIEAPPNVSMTHTDGMVAVALAGDRCGVDVEHVERPVSARRLAKRFFPSREFELLSKLPDTEFHREFILRWTVREAWTKAERSTFLDALKRCETRRIANGQLELLVDATSHVTTGHLFSDTVDEYVITALSCDDDCEALSTLGRVCVRVD